MKKTKLTRSLLAACSIVALSAVMYGCVHNGGDDAPATDMSGTPDPEPIEPAGPTDLEDTQTAAAAAAAAAMTASDAAAKAADDAATATMYLATLQTGADSNSDAMGGREAALAASEAAADAADAASAAADASAAAAAATTGDDGEAAWRMAVAAQEAAEAAQMDAETASAAAVEAAATELHIKGTVKWAGAITADEEGASSVDAAADTSLSQPVPATAGVSTGFQGYVSRETDDVPGKAFVHTTVRADDQPYVQAVEGRPVHIGKTLDTTDDAAGLTVIHSRVGSKKVSVYAVALKDDKPIEKFVFTTTPATPTTEETKEAMLVLGTYEPTPLAYVSTLKPHGTYYKATQITLKDDDTTTPVNEAVGEDGEGLDHGDKVGATTKGKEVFSYLYLDGDGKGVRRYIVELSRDVTVGGDTVVTYQHVDVTALAAPDIARDVLTPVAAGDHEEVQVKAVLPVAKAYDHIHFGVWDALDEATTAGQKLAGVGIGFVQSVGDGITDRLGIGTVTYKGDWVAVLQRKNSAAEGAFNLRDGAATMTADFDMEEFEADLKGLAMLEGTLDGNGFSGMTATQISHDDLDSTGTFTGEFSGNIYGDKGEEAAGAFDFAGGEAGSFRGAFGGTNQK